MSIARRLVWRLVLRVSVFDFEKSMGRIHGVHREISTEDLKDPSALFAPMADQLLERLAEEEREPDGDRH